MASSFVVGGPQIPKDPGLGGFSPIPVLLVPSIWPKTQKRLRHAELENPTPQFFAYSAFSCRLSPAMNDNNFLTAPNWPQPLGMPPRTAQAHRAVERKFPPDRPFFRCPDRLISEMAIIFDCCAGWSTWYP